MSYFFWISTKILVVCQLAQRKVIEYTTVNISWNATQSVKLKATNKRKERNYLTKKVFFFIESGGIGIVEMLFCTSLVALVGGGETPAFSPRQLQIINTKVCKNEH